MLASHQSSQSWHRDTAEMSRLIMPDVIERERELAHSKWFPYRFISPLRATKHFADLYREGYKAYVRTNVDAETSEKVKGLSLQIFNKPSGDLTQLWMARQRADDLGVPYELLISFGFLFASRRTWNYPPRPVQLFGTKESQVAWPAEFKKYLDEHLPLALDRMSGPAQYRTENYRGLVDQDEFRDLLLDRIRGSVKPWSATIGLQCVEQRHLPLSSVVELVPEHLRNSVAERVRDDLQSGALDPVERECLPEMAFVPGCYGTYAPESSSVAMCRSCPFAAQCAELTVSARDQVAASYGSNSPVKAGQDDRRKAGQRRRTKRCRDKKKALAAAFAVAA